MKISSAGVHSLLAVKGDPNRYLISLKDGKVMVYNIKKREIDFETESGHAETVFDLKFSNMSRDHIASCSYDGTVRLWDVNSMKLLSVCDTRRNTPIKKDAKHIIYSISWSPTE